MDDPLLRLFSIVYSEGPLIILMLIRLTQTLELNYTNPINDLISDYLSQQILPLNNKNVRKLGLRCCLLSGVLIKVVYKPLVIFIFIGQLAVNIVSYFDPAYNFTIISIIICNIAAFSFIVQFFATIFYLLCAFVFAILYVKYKFLEIHHKFLLSLSFKHKSHLDLIAQHYTVCRYVHQLNRLGSPILFILYYLATPGFMVMIRANQSDKLLIFGEIFNAINIIIIFGANFTANMISSSVNRAAKMSLNYMHQYIAKNELTPIQRMKTMAMIERLSGPDLGFYCYDLFPMNSYEFYIYVANCAKTYFLVIDIISSK